MPVQARRRRTRILRALRHSFAFAHFAFCYSEFRSFEFRSFEFGSLLANAWREFSSSGSPRSD